ncbi:uncharacterized protein Eint_081510 [Encephalitozoon intestinalis ATCC 50506]|uniref:Uncharacterized protein n=1 Tax=Encephalitozoon intestinalis (strain ATCC 50506) TaxID=876142 RepID=E0S8M7_ENCIT|nr:uncharacterized protein Eint_081510 [Encephalitozoon intestinalis ATCC 50506]ADM12083.1 hypothetical protein Eint_081510 [Encephalitozoon intestinalis ATCC 50506]UTX45875.1 hypothetical protein GPK93_08g14540 [Encephalitozoon intestinalis]
MSELNGLEENKLDGSLKEKDVGNDNSESGKTYKSTKKRILSMRDESKENPKQVRMSSYYEKKAEESGIRGGDEKGGKNGILKQAIWRRDLSYISEFLLRKDRGLMLKTLSYEDKEVLGEILLEFVDQPLRIEALETMREIVSSIKNVGLFIRKLKERAIDFSKLIYLKGKIDYLRFTAGNQEEKEPEITVKG